jgi:hypothetical protein
MVGVRINPDLWHIAADGVDLPSRRQYFHISADSNNLDALAQHINAKLTIGIDDGVATYCRGSMLRQEHLFIEFVFFVTF